MINYKLIRVSKLIAIIILLVVFSIAGFVSCKKKVTQPSASQTPASDTGFVMPEPDKTGPLDTDLPSWGEEYAIELPAPEPPKRTFPDNTYMTVYTPWRGENYPRVSWQDSETLLRMWKEMMSRKWPADGKRWYIKGRSYGNWNYSPDRWKDPMFYTPPEYNYYYFDKNYDIVYCNDARKVSLKIMKLVGATIVRWNKARNDNNKGYIGTWTVGGIYQTININEVEAVDRHGDLKFFMRMDDITSSRNDKPLQVINMNLGYNDINFIEFGVDNYYHTTSGDYNNITAFTNKTPQELDKFLNAKINLSWQWTLDWHNWRFFPRNVDSWHLEAHPDHGVWLIEN